MFYYYYYIIIYIPISGLGTRYRNHGYCGNQLNVICIHYRDIYAFNNIGTYISRVINVVNVCFDLLFKLKLVLAASRYLHTLNV